MIRYKILKTRTLTDNLGSQTNFVRDCLNTRRYGQNLLSYLALTILDKIPSEMKNINALQKFKIEFRK